MIEGAQLKLYFGPHLIGRVSNTFCSDSNWYGTLHAASEAPERLRQFIALCQDWHVRLDAGRPHDPDEFNDWRDIHESAAWQVVAPDGQTDRIRTPVFWPNGDLCWRAVRDADLAAAPGRSDS